jgi:hypothetical protein
MKRAVILLSLGIFLAVSCEKKEQESQVSDVSFTPCLQSELRSSSEDLSKVDVEFTNKGVQIKHYNFDVHCDFTTVNVTHTFLNGVLNITQQEDGNARCICYTDVSYTISGISQNQVNVIFINGVQVYCYNSQSNCDPNVIIDAEEYFKVPEFHGVISNMRIEGNNLKFTVTNSGCDGSSWVVKLITTGAIEKSLPPQRTLQLSFVNNEACTAVIGREFSFRIECLQVPSYGSVYLNILGKYGILYEY